VNPTFQSEAEAAPVPAPPPPRAAGPAPSVLPAVRRPKAAALGLAGRWLKPSVIALLVVVAGALAGVAGFAAEQRFADWDPSVDAAATGGWRVAGSAELRPVGPEVAGGRLVWNQGPYTCTLTLDSGETHVVGVAPPWMTAGSPAADGSRTAWLEVPRDAGERRHGQVWAYDAVRGRRQSWVVGTGSTWPAVDGALVAWLDGGGAPTVRVLNTTTGHQSVIARAPGIVGPVLAGGGLVGWLRMGVNGSGPVVVLRDPAGGATTTVPLARRGEDAAAGDVQLAAGVLVWSVQSEEETRIVVRDLRSRRSRVVARGAVSSPATDGSLVVWVAADGSDGCVVRGLRRVGGGVVELARPAAWPSSLAVGDGWIAWVLDQGNDSILVAERIAR
jgi:hypothetical protein